MVTSTVFAQQQNIFKQESKDQKSDVKDKNYRVISELQKSSTFIRVKFQVFRLLANNVNCGYFKLQNI